MEKDLNQRLTDREQKLIRRFGFNFAIGMAVLFLVSLWRNFPLPFKIGAALLGVYHLCFAILNYRWLYPTYKLVSGIALLLGNILTTAIFTVVFYLLFTPIALVLRLCKKDVIRTNSHHPRWLPIPEAMNNPERIKRLF
jgi:hypothetical protein